MNNPTSLYCDEEDTVKVMESMEKMFNVLSKDDSDIRGNDAHNPEQDITPIINGISNIIESFSKSSFTRTRLEKSISKGNTILFAEYILTYVIGWVWWFAYGSEKQPENPTIVQSYTQKRIMNILRDYVYKMKNKYPTLYRFVEFYFGIPVFMIHHPVLCAFIGGFLFSKVYTLP